MDGKLVYDDGKHDHYVFGGMLLLKGYYNIAFVLIGVLVTGKHITTQLFLFLVHRTFH